MPRVSVTPRKRRPRDLGAFTRATGKLIAAARLLRGFTQEGAAAKTEMDARQWQRIEAGAYNMTLSTLLHVAQLLDVEPRDLLPAGPWRATPRRSATADDTSVSTGKALRTRETESRAEPTTYRGPGRPRKP